MNNKRKKPRQVVRIYCRGDGAINHRCSYGCIGCLACVNACRRKAIEVSVVGIAEVIEERCVGCGLCEKVCPQQIIHKRYVDVPFVPFCANKDKAVECKSVCSKSCIGCKLCEKRCPSNAIVVEEHLARIEEETCLSCGFCAVICPRNVIVDTRGIFTLE